MIIRDLHRSLRGMRYSLPNQAQAPLSSVSVSWKWYDQSQGVVEWTFTNDGSQKESVILLRNGYYFGGAFAPVYLANSTPLCSTCTGSNGFGVSWIYTEPTQGGVSLVNGEIPPLLDGLPEDNAPPMAPVQFPNGQWLNFAFIFTLNPGQIWSMLEGGFSTLMPPYPQGVYPVSLGYTGPTCVGYDPQRVKDWDTQTGTSLQGYSPNPATFNIATVKALGAPYDVLPFNDPPIQLSVCSQPNPQPQPQPQPSPSPTPNPIQCIDDILQAIATYQTNPTEATQLLVQGIICILDTLDVQPSVFLDSFLRLHGVTVEELLKAVGEYDAEKVKALVKNWFK